MMKEFIQTGEERLGKIVQQLMSNEKFMMAVQTAITQAMQAKGFIDKSVNTALSAMNVPTRRDFDHLRGRMDDIEAQLASVESRLQELEGEKN